MEYIPPLHFPFLAEHDLQQKEKADLKQQKLCYDIDIHHLSCLNLKQRPDLRFHLLHQRFKRCRLSFRLAKDFNVKEEFKAALQDASICVKDGNNALKFVLLKAEIEDSLCLTEASIATIARGNITKNDTDEHLMTWAKKIFQLIEDFGRREILMEAAKKIDNEVMLQRIYSCIIKKNDLNFLGVLMAGVHGQTLKFISNSLHCIFKYLKCSDIEQMRNNSYPIYRIFDCGASFRKAEILLSMPLIHYAMNFSLQGEGNPEVLELVLREYATTSTMRLKENNNRETILQVFRKGREKLTECHRKAVENVLHEFDLDGDFEYEGNDISFKKNTESTKLPSDLERVIAMHTMNQFEDAISAYESVEKSYDVLDLRHVAKAAAISYKETKQYWKAITTARIYLRQKCDDLTMHELMAFCYQQLQNYDRSINEYILALNMISSKQAENISEEGRREDIMKKLSIALSKEDNSQEQNLTERLEHCNVDIWIDATYSLIQTESWEGASGAYRQLQKCLYSKKPVLPERKVTLRPFYCTTNLENQDFYWIPKFINILMKCGSEISTLTQGLEYPFVHAYVRIVMLTGVTDHLRDVLRSCSRSSTDNHGNTPMHTACKEPDKYGQLQTVMDILSEFGFNPKQQNNAGQSAKNLSSRKNISSPKRPPSNNRSMHKPKITKDTDILGMNEQSGSTILYKREQRQYSSCSSVSKQDTGDTAACEQCQQHFTEAKQLEEQKDYDGFLDKLTFIFEHNCKKRRHREVELAATKCLTEHIASHGEVFLEKYVSRIKPQGMKKIIKELEARQMWIQIMHVINSYNKKRGESDKVKPNFKTEVYNVLLDTKDQMEEDIRDCVQFMLDHNVKLHKDGRDEVRHILHSKMYRVLVVVLQNSKDEIFFTTLDLILNSNTGEKDTTALENLLRAKTWREDLCNASGQSVFHILCRENCSEHIFTSFLQHNFSKALRDRTGKLPVEYLDEIDQKRRFFQDSSQDESRGASTFKQNLDNEEGDEDNKTPVVNNADRTLTVKDIVEGLPDNVEDLLLTVQNLVNDMSEMKNQKMDSNDSRAKEGGRANSLEDDNNAVQNVDTEESVYQYDLMDWDVECTASVWKLLVCDKKIPKHLKQKTLDIVHKLASGEFEHEKKLKIPENLKLYESRLDDAARIIWQKTIAFSPKKTEKLTVDKNPHGIKNVYCDIIRVWDIVTDHDNLSDAVEKVVDKIKKSTERGKECKFQKKIKLDERIHSLKSVDRREMYVATRKTPRLYIEADEDIDAQSIFPQASPESKEYHIFKFYQFSTTLAKNIVGNVPGFIDFPFKETPHEFSVITLPTDCPILLLGRSGTGKTTCCLYRLWNELCLHLSRTRGIEAEFQQEEPKAGEGFDGTDTEMGFNQIFVTKNSVLCKEVEKNFRGFCRAEALTIHLTKEGCLDLPFSIADVRGEQFPVFLTSRQLLLMLDAALGPNYFFERDESGSPLHRINGWTDDSSSKKLIDRSNEDKDIFQDEDDTDDETDELFFDQEETKNENKKRKKTKKGHSDMRERKEVTYKIFSSEIWPSLMHKSDKTHPSAVWTEFMSFIKGSFESLMSKNRYLSREEYIDIGKKRAPNFVDCRDKIYHYFLQYEQYKRESNMFDEIDVVRHILQRYLRRKNENGMNLKIHKFYVDETQDFTQAELFLFLILLEDPNQIFLTGDTAQGIMHGISFRFEDLKTLFYQLRERYQKEGSVLNVKVPKLQALPFNYRSHDGIIKLASSVLDILRKYFPVSFDKAEECGMLPGPEPVLIEPKSPSDLLTLLRGSIRKTSSPIEFGAHQAILVYDDKSRLAVPSELQDSLILTIFESKGLEFDDILLYNFFTDSQADKEWRLAYTYLSQSSKRDNEQGTVVQREKEKSVHRVIKEDDAKITKVLQTELKQLYTAITRARVNVWIYDENEGKRKPMFKYFQERKLVRELRINLMDEETNRDMMVPEESSKEEWMLRGQQLLQIGLYELATKCFLKGGNEYKARTAYALNLASKANEKDREIAEREKLNLQAAQLFLTNDLPNKATKCLVHAGEKEILAQLYEKKGKFFKAGKIYLGLGKIDDFIRNYQSAWKFKDAVDILSQRQLYSHAKDVFRYFQDLKAKFGDDVPTELVANDPDTSIDALSLSEANYWEREGDDKAMLKALKDMKDVEVAVDFLSERDKVSELVHILQNKGWHKRVVQEYLKLGKTEEAIHYCEEIHDNESVCSCLISDSIIKLSSDTLLTLDMHDRVFENLIYVLNDQKTRDKDLAGKAAYLLGKLTNDQMWIGKSFGLYSKANPMKNKAGMLECMAWMMSNADIEDPENLRKIILGLENSFEVLAILANATKKEHLYKIFDDFGLSGRTHNLVYYPKQHPKILQCIEGSPSQTIETISQTKARRIIFNFLVKKMKEWHTKILKTLTCMREKLLMCGIAQRHLPFKTYPENVSSEICIKNHFQSCSGIQFHDLISIDLFLFQLGYTMQKGSEELKDICHDELYLTFEATYWEEFHTFTSYLIGDLFLSLQFPLVNQSMMKDFRSYIGRRKKTEQSILQSAPDPFHIQRGIRALLSKSEVLAYMKKGNQTVLFMNFYFLFHMTKDLLHTLPIPSEKLEVYEKEIKTESMKIRKDKAIPFLRSLGFEFSVDRDTNAFEYKGLRVRHFYNAMSHLYNKEDAVMAFIEFSKFVRIRDRNLNMRRLPDLSDLFLLLENFTSLALFVVSKYLQSKGGEPQVVLLPKAYLKSSEMLNVLLFQKSRERYRLKNLVEKSNIKDLETVLKSFESIVDFICVKRKGFLDCLTKEGTFPDSDVLTFLPRCVVLMGTWLCNAGHTLPFTIETKLRRAFNDLKPPFPLPSSIQFLIDQVNTASCQRSLGVALNEYLRPCQGEDGLIVHDWKKTSITVNMDELEKHLSEDHYSKIETEVSHKFAPQENDPDFSQEHQDLQENIMNESSESASKASKRNIFAERLKNLSEHVKWQLLDDKKNMFEDLFSSIKIDNDFCGFCRTELETEITNQSEHSQTEEQTIGQNEQSENLRKEDFIESQINYRAIHESKKNHKWNEQNAIRFKNRFRNNLLDQYFEAHFASDNFSTPEDGYLMNKLRLPILKYRSCKREADKLLSSIIKHRTWSEYSSLKNVMKELCKTTRDMQTRVRAAINEKRRFLRKQRKEETDRMRHFQFNEEDFPELPQSSASGLQKGSISSDERCFHEKMLDDFLRNQENKLHRLFLGKDKNAKLHICAVFEEKSKNIPHSFKNVPVVSKRRSDNNYSALKAMYGHNGSIPDDEKQAMEEILRLRSDELMQTHSNLEILTISPSKFRDESEEFVEEPCFVMYCTFKGIIPINENPFPKTIDKWPVDVREGMFYLLPGNGDVTFPSSVSYFKQVQMGCNIGAANGRKNGTLGGFVDCPKNGLCFITCAHVLHDITVTNPNIPQSAPLTPYVSVVQPGPSQPNAELCGHEVMSYFGTTSNGVTVDASLVKVLPDRVPDRGNFAGLTMDDLEIIGFDGKESPEYSNGAIKTTLHKGDRLQHLIKCGTNTGITRGTLKVKGTCVRLSEYAISFNTQQTNGFYAKQQYEIIPPGGRPFANVGDSGSFVFMLDKDEDLHCIGMLIGVTNLFTGIVTPIGDILDTFNIPHQNMHCFTSDPMQE